MLKKLLNLFYPKVCSGCMQLLLTSEDHICTDCRHEIPLTNHLLAVENEAFKKFYGRLPVEHVSAMLYYYKKGITQQLIHNLKYRNQPQIGTILGKWYVEDLKRNPIINSIDFIIPVPLHKKRLKKRGYNQVASFCQEIAQGINKEIDTTLLIRSKYAISQSKKNLITRSEISENTFDVTFNHRHHNKHFLLIDDVLTTGATLEACGKAIFKIPGAKLSIVTMAYSES